MKDKTLNPYAFLIVLPIILLSFFLNYLSSSYSEIDLFKLDFTRKKKSKSSRRLVFILKNSHLLFTVICFIQVILNTLVSTILIDKLRLSKIQEKTGIGRNAFLIGTAFFTAIFTELLARFLAVRKSNLKFSTHPFFVSLTYLILRPFTFLQVVIKPKKKLFSDSEQDIIHFFNNLLAEKVLEEKEVRLVQSALRFDELTIEHITVPWQKVIFLEETMSLAEIKKIYSQYFFTRYPVRNKGKKVIGILSMKRVFHSSIKEDEFRWQDQVDKKLLHLSPETKLDKAFEKTQTWNCRMMIIKNQKKGSAKKEGIVTLHDILNALVGKIRHSPEEKLPLLPPPKSV